MGRNFAIFLLVLLLAGLVYSTYSFSQGNFLQGLSIFPFLIGCYLFIMAWQKRQENQAEQEEDEEQ